MALLDYLFRLYRFIDAQHVSFHSSIMLSMKQLKRVCTELDDEKKKLSGNPLAHFTRLLTLRKLILGIVNRDPLPLISSSSFDSTFKGQGYYLQLAEAVYEYVEKVPTFDSEGITYTSGSSPKRSGVKLNQVSPRPEEEPKLNQDIRLALDYINKDPVYSVPMRNAARFRHVRNTRPRTIASRGSS